MQENLKYSFVIPAFNEQDNIKVLYARIQEIAEKLNIVYEIIFINDGSRDNTIDVLKELAEVDIKIKILDFSRNFGHQSALTAGLLYASGDAVISMDCDLQDPPEVIEKMIEKWQEGYKVVYARRLNYRNDNVIKKLGSKIYYKALSKFSTVYIPRNVGDFRLIDKKVLKEINKMNEHSRYLRGMVAWTGFEHAFVDYYRPDRSEGESGYSMTKLAGLGMDGMLNFSVIPLRMGLFLGIFSIICGFGLLTYQIFDYFVHNAYYHLYKWLIVVIFIFTGFLFMLLWIIGEYIGKIYDDVRNRPSFIIKETMNV